MIAKADDIISFERDGHQLAGTVLFVYQNSVCVELFEESIVKFGERRTVVAHKNYIVSAVKIS